MQDNYRAKANEIANVIWSVADSLRGLYKQADYGKVILPMTVLRRLDSVLTPTKQKVLEFLPKTEAMPIMQKTQHSIKLRVLTSTTAVGLILQNSRKNPMMWRRICGIISMVFPFPQEKFWSILILKRIFKNSMTLKRARICSTPLSKSSMPLI